MNDHEPATNPDYYERSLSDESRITRVGLEEKFNELADRIESEPNPLTRMQLAKEQQLVEYQLGWQGADPRDLDKKELRMVCNQPLHEDSVIDKYRSKVRNPATAIRAYCVNCMGGSVAGVKDCMMLSCPLWSFRMGKDPLRGYKLPPYIEPTLAEDDADAEDDDLFDAEDEDTDEDAEE